MSFPKVPKIYPGNASCANMFGCYEMEQAASVILQKILERRDWESSIDHEDFMQDRYLRIGFLLLAAYKWLIPDYPNGIFIVHHRFANRIVNLLPMKPEERTVYKGI